MKLRPLNEIHQLQESVGGMILFASCAACWMTHAPIFIALTMTPLTFAGFWLLKDSLESWNQIDWPQPKQYPENSEESESEPTQKLGE